VLTVLAILFWLLVGIIALLAILLCTPIYLKMVLKSGPKPVFNLEVRVISSSAPRLFRIGQGPRSKQDRRGRDRKGSSRSVAKTKKQKADKNRTLWRKMPDLAPKLPPLIADTLSGLHFDHLKVRGEFGFGDPADTGRAFGYIAPFVYAPQSPKILVQVVPDFEKPCLRGQAEAALHFVPIRLALPTLRFLWSQFVVAR
jgi:hypothetical protein